MKKLVIIFAIAASLLANSAMAKGKEKPAKDKSVVVLSTKRDVFYFKIDKEFLGGVVEVYDADNELVGSQDLIERKMIVDFFEVLPGTYTIKIKKDGMVKEFSYEKEE